MKAFLLYIVLIALRIVWINEVNFGFVNDLNLNFVIFTIIYKPIECRTIYLIIHHHNNNYSCTINILYKMILIYKLRKIYLRNWKGNEENENFNQMKSKYSKTS